MTSSSFHASLYPHILGPFPLGTINPRSLANPALTLTRHLTAAVARHERTEKKLKWVLFMRVERGQSTSWVP